MSTTLLDVNVLLALFDSNHAQHGPVADWFSKTARSGWATCPITQNGFVRIMSQASYPNSVPLSIAAQALRHACESDYHRFWPCDISLLDETTVFSTKLLSPGSITDAYLLALAVAHNGRFATLDQRIATATVPGASAHHLWHILRN